MTSRDLVNIPSLYLEEFQRLKHLSGVDQGELLSDRDDLPPGLDHQTVESWLLGTEKAAKIAHLDYVLDAWRARLREPTALSERDQAKNAALVLRRDVNPSYVREDHLDLALNNAGTEPPPVDEFVALDAATLQDVRSRIKAAGRGARAWLLRAANRPSDLTRSKLRSLMHGNPKYARASHLDFIKASLRDYAEKAGASLRRTELTAEVVEALKRERERTGIGAAKLLAAAGDAPHGHSARAIYNWLSGFTKSANADHLKWTLSRWQALPDREAPAAATAPPARPQTEDMPAENKAERCPDDHVRLDDNVRAQLRFLQKRTGTKPATLLREAPGVPVELNAQDIARWIAGRAEFARKDYLDFVLARWQEILSDGSYLVPITEEIRASLLAEQDRTRLGPAALLRESVDVPTDLTPGMVVCWINGRTRSARKRHLDFVTRRWREVRHEGMERVAITKDVRAALIAENERTGMSSTSLLRNAPDVPAGLTRGMIASWIRGKASTARKDHLDYVMATWREQPDLPSGRAKQRRAPSTRASRPMVEITDKERSVLNDLIDRSGIGPHALLRGARHTAPDGLYGSVIRDWLQGDAVLARQDHYDFALGRWQASLQAGAELIEIDEETRQRISDEIARAGRGAHLRLIKAEDRPAGLSGRKLQRILSGKESRIWQSDLDYLLEALAQLPSRPPARYNQHESWVDIDEATLDALRAERARTGVGSGALLKSAGQVPKGITPGVIRHWVAGITRTAIAGYPEWVLAQWRMLPDKPQPARSESVGSAEIEDLRQEMARAGMVPGDFLKGWRRGELGPHGLTPATINAWLNGKAAKIDPAQFTYVLRFAQQMPTCDAERVPVDQALLRSLQASSAIKALELVSTAADPPTGLTFQVVNAMLNGTMPEARQDHYDYVVGRWRELAKDDPMDEE